MQQTTIRRRWLFFSILGLLLTGFGLSLTGYALQLRIEGSSTSLWVVWGTLALSVFNAGLCFFGQGVLERQRLNQG